MGIQDLVRWVGPVRKTKGEFRSQTAIGLTQLGTMAAGIVTTEESIGVQKE